MQKLLLVLSASFICFIFGCSQDEISAIPSNPLELFSRYESKIETGKPCTVDQMQDADIIVAVNGYPMTKAYYNELYDLRTKYLMKQRGANSLLVAQKMDEAKQKIVQEFIAQRLLLDDAMARGVVSTNSIRENIQIALKEISKKTRKSPKKILSSYDGDVRHFYYGLGMEYATGKLIKEKVPPKFKVTDDFVEVVQKQIDAENAEIVKSNNVIKAMMMELKRKIDAKQIDFEDAYRALRGIEKDAPKDDFVEVVERDDIEDKVFQLAVFTAPEGSITDVIEGDEGFYLAKVVSYNPPEKNKKGGVVKKDRRGIIQIYEEKIPLIVREANKEMFSDLENQMQLQAINEHVEFLRTNGLNRVEFPHGTVLFEK